MTMSTTEDLGALTPVPLMQISTGFWAFKTLAAANELDVFTRLAGGAEMTAEELARELAIEQRPAEMLLTGCASLGLLERGHHGYRNTPLSERFLVRGARYFFGGLVTMFDRRLYPGWAELTEAIRTNRPTTWDRSASAPCSSARTRRCSRPSGRRCTRCRASPPAHSPTRSISTPRRDCSTSAAAPARSPSSSAGATRRCARPSSICPM